MIYIMPTLLLAERMRALDVRKRSPLIAMSFGGPSFTDVRLTIATHPDVFYSREHVHRTYIGKH